MTIRVYSALEDKQTEETFRCNGIRQYLPRDTGVGRDEPLIQCWITHGLDDKGKVDRKGGLRTFEAKHIISVEDTGVETRFHDARYGYGRHLGDVLRAERRRHRRDAQEDLDAAIAEGTVPRGAYLVFDGEDPWWTQDGKLLTHLHSGKRRRTKPSERRTRATRAAVQADPTAGLDTEAARLLRQRGSVTHIQNDKPIRRRRIKRKV